MCSSHTAPVWQLAWAHPSLGSILASCSYDGRVFIWKEVAGGGKGSGGELQDGWERIKEHTLHTASGMLAASYLSTTSATDTSTVNSIAWAPYDLGPILACASSDGKISVLSFQSELFAIRSLESLADDHQTMVQPMPPSSLPTEPGQMPSLGLPLCFPYPQANLAHHLKPVQAYNSRNDSSRLARTTLYGSGGMTRRRRSGSRRRSSKVMMIGFGMSLGHRTSAYLGCTLPLPHRSVIRRDDTDPNSTDSTQGPC